MKLKGRSVAKGVAAGKALVSRQRISFLGAVEPTTGVVVDKTHDLYGKGVASRVLVFPGGKGSTVGSYVIYQLKKHGKSPAAMVILDRSADTIVAVGAIIAEIPAVDSVELKLELGAGAAEGEGGRGLLRDGEEVVVNADEGYIEF
ncbi:MAG: aconitase X swivel domain-containing protein [Candidatus Methanospirareceae archaeon]